MPKCYKKFYFDAMFDFHGFQKGILWSTFSLKVFSFAVSFSGFGRPCRNPVFHENMVSTVPFGPSGFFKVSFSMKIG